MKKMQELSVMLLCVNFVVRKREIKEIVDEGFNRHMQATRIVCSVK